MDIRKYAKAIIAILGAVLTAALTQLPDAAVLQQYGPIVAALLTALGVFLVPNLPGTDGADPDYGDGPVSEEPEGA